MCSSVSRDADVAGGGEDLVQQRAPLLLGTGIVRPQQRQQIALGLVGHHLDDVGQVLALGGELDHGTLAEVSDLDALREASRRCSMSLAQASARRAQLLAECCHGRS